MNRIHAVDSHTGGEPTRVVVSGGPDLGSGPLSERLQRFRADHDKFRSAVVNEPRGSDAVVGALLCEPHEPGCDAGVIFFNNVGYLGMCGHGTIGLAVTLGYLGSIRPGMCHIDTPVGTVTAELHTSNEVTIGNVPSYRHTHGVEVRLQDGEIVRGDVAWGGNWFFLVHNRGPELSLKNIEELTDYSWRIREALTAGGITGEGGAEIDHIELCVEPGRGGADSRNFVLCPGKAYDRSPCGTGTSAKIACLAAEGRLAPGAVWRQESVAGSVFEARYELRDGKIHPFIRGSAFVNCESKLVLDPADPFCWGIRA